MLIRINTFDWTFYYLLEHRKRRESVRCIMRYFHAYKLRTALAIILYQHRIECAIHIQRVYRGHLGRTLFYELIILLRKKVVFWNKNITEIQKIWRGYAAKKILIILKEEAAYKKQLRLLEKPELLNRRYRSKLQQKIYDIKEQYLFSYFLNKIHNKNALIIQRVYRGHRKRKLRLRLRIIKMMNYINNKIKTEISSVVTIQKHWKGYWVRKIPLTNLRYKMAVKLQAFWRMKLYKWRYVLTVKKNAAILIMHKVMLAYVKKQVGQIRYRIALAQHIPAMKIQRCIRRYQAKQYFPILKNKIRTQNEMFEYAKSLSRSVLCEIQLKIIQESMARDISIKPNTYSPIECPYNG